MPARNDIKGVEIPAEPSQVRIWATKQLQLAKNGDPGAKKRLREHLAFLGHRGGLKVLKWK